MADLHAVVRRHLGQRGMSLRQLAEAVHYDASYLSKALRGLKPCPPRLAADIDEALAAGGEIIRAAARESPGEGARGSAEAMEVMSWATATNASDDAIGQLSRDAEYLAEAHGRMPAGRVLREVLGVHRAAHALLRGGRQRMAQTRELLRVDSALLAHACLLSGDLGRYQAARQFGGAALILAQEAGSDEGMAWTAMAKTARWQDQFTEAAGLAARGFEASGAPPIRAELAYREANAIALFGDVPRAREALARAGRACEGLDDDGASAWSFSRGRRAIFTLSVCARTGDPDGALAAARDADDWWDGGAAKVAATWAQVRAGAAMAWLLKDSLDAAEAQLRPVLELPPDQRISTVTGWLDEIAGLLRAPRFAGAPAAALLGEEIREFASAAAAGA